MRVTQRRAPQPATSRPAPISHDARGVDIATAGRVLIDIAAGIAGRETGDHAGCDWLIKPGEEAAARGNEPRREAVAVNRSERADAAEPGAAVHQRLWQSRREGFGIRQIGVAEL